MAATRLIALHVNKGKTVAQCLKDRTDYAQNPEKTQKGELVTGFQCDPMTADEEFLLSKRQYQHITGKYQKNNVIAYQIRQSFKPGEITAEEANQVGRELAERFTKGKHAFIVATQTVRIYTITLFSIPPVWIPAQNSKIFIFPGWRFSASVILSAWSMAFPLSRRSHMRCALRIPFGKIGFRTEMYFGKQLIPF